VQEDNLLWGNFRYKWYEIADYFVIIGNIVRMAEWTNATVCKTVARKGYPGSNPGPDTKDFYATEVYSPGSSRFVLTDSRDETNPGPDTK
jgi:hypothetical protein